jgi:DNA polymerase type B, organellar and viral
VTHANARTVRQTEKMENDENNNNRRPPNPKDKPAKKFRFNRDAQDPPPPPPPNFMVNANEVPLQVRFRSHRMQTRSQSRNPPVIPPVPGPVAPLPRGARPAGGQIIHRPITRSITRRDARLNLRSAQGILDTANARAPLARAPGKPRRKAIDEVTKKKAPKEAPYPVSLSSRRKRNLVWRGVEQPIERPIENVWDDNPHPEGAPILPDEPPTPPLTPEPDGPTPPLSPLNLAGVVIAPRVPWILEADSYVQVIPNSNVMNMWANGTPHDRLPNPHGYAAADPNNNDAVEQGFPEWEEALSQFMIQNFIAHNVSHWAHTINVQFTFFDATNGVHNMTNIMFKDIDDHTWNGNDQLMQAFKERISAGIKKMMDTGRMRDEFARYDNIMPAIISSIGMRAVVTGWRNPNPGGVGCTMKRQSERKMIGKVYVESYPMHPKFLNSCTIACVLKAIEVYERQHTINVPPHVDRLYELCCAVQDYLLQEHYILWSGLFELAWMPHLAKYLGICIEVYNEDAILYNRSGIADGERPIARLLLHQNHCYTVIRGGVCFNCGEVHKHGKMCGKCEECGERKVDWNHICNFKTKAESFFYLRNRANNINQAKSKNTLIKGKKIYEKEYGKKLVFSFDCESFFDQTGNHTVYCIGAKSGLLCEQEDRSLAYTHVEYERFKGRKCIEDFFDWTLTQYTKYKKEILQTKKKLRAYVLAFNGARYDFVLCMRTLVARARQYKLRNIIMGSNEIMAFEYGESIKVRDLLMLMTKMSLSDAARAFGLDKTVGLAKGEFPHLWLGRQEDPWEIVDNGYVGPHPSRDDYIRVKDFPDPVPESWDFQACSDKYLKMDVDILFELIRLLTSTIFEHLYMNLLDRFTAPQLAMEFWKSLVAPHKVDFDPDAIINGKDEIIEESKKVNFHPFPELITPREIHIITDELKEKIIRQSIYGGLVYPTQFSYESTEYEAIKRKELDFDKINDFCVAIDYSGLYAGAMAKFKYPYGAPSERITNPYAINSLIHSLAEVDHPDDVPMFIAAVDRVCPDNIAIPVLPRRENKSLKWDLLEGYGVYTSVDLWMSVKRGYQFQAARIPEDDEFFCIKFSKSAKIFQNAMLKGNQLRDIGEKAKNEAVNGTGKLINNSLYGKAAEEPIYDEVHIIDGDRIDWKAAKFLENNRAKSWFPIHDDTDQTLVGLGVLGEAKNKEKRVKSPGYLGSIILAWARYLMQEYQDKIDDNINSDPYESLIKSSLKYRDTDSLLLEVNEEKFQWMQKEIISPTKEQGRMYWDLKGGVTKVVRAVLVAPKTYMFEYIIRDHKDQRNYEIKYKMRAKGMPSDFLKPELYNDILEAIYDKLGETLPEELDDRNFRTEISAEMRIKGERTLNTIKKVVINMNGKEKEANRMHGSCYNTLTTRCFMRNIYWGRKPVFIGREGRWHLLPWGYNEDIIQDPISFETPSSPNYQDQEDSEEVCVQLRHSPLIPGALTLEEYEQSTREWDEQDPFEPLPSTRVLQLEDSTQEALAPMEESLDSLFQADLQLQLLELDPLEPQPLGEDLGMEFGDPSPVLDFPTYFGRC